MVVETKGPKSSIIYGIILHIDELIFLRWLLHHQPDSHSSNLNGMKMMKMNFSPRIYNDLYVQKKGIFIMGWVTSFLNKLGNGADKRPCSGVRSTFVASVSNLNFLRVFQHLHHINVFSMSLKPRSVHRKYSLLSVLPQKTAFFNDNSCFRNFA